MSSGERSHFKREAPPGLSIVAVVGVVAETWGRRPIIDRTGPVKRATLLCDWRSRAAREFTVGANGSWNFQQFRVFNEPLNDPTTPHARRPRRSSSIPQDSAEPFRAAVEAKTPIPDPKRPSVKYLGGWFCELGHPDDKPA